MVLPSFGSFLFPVSLLFFFCLGVSLCVCVSLLVFLSSDPFFPILSSSFFGNFGILSVLWNLCWIRRRSYCEAVLACSGPTSIETSIFAKILATTHSVSRPRQPEWLMYCIYLGTGLDLGYCNDIRVFFDNCGILTIEWRYDATSVFWLILDVVDPPTFAPGRYLPLVGTM